MILLLFFAAKCNQSWAERVLSAKSNFIFTIFCTMLRRPLSICLLLSIVSSFLCLLCFLLSFFVTLLNLLILFPPLLFILLCTLICISFCYYCFDFFYFYIFKCWRLPYSLFRWLLLVFKCMFWLRLVEFYCNLWIFREFWVICLILH